MIKTLSLDLGYSKCVCEGPFLDSVQARIEARTLGLELLFKGTGFGSPQLNGMFTNRVVHRARILQYIHTSRQENIGIEQQEIVKDQSNKERDRIIVRDP